MRRRRRRGRNLGWGPRGGLDGGPNRGLRRDPGRWPGVLKNQAGWAPLPSRGRVPLLDSNPPNWGLGGSRSFHIQGGSRSQLRRPPLHASHVFLKMLLKMFCRDDGDV